jgi:hypothetical protein
MRTHFFTTLFEPNSHPAIAARRWRHTSSPPHHVFGHPRRRNARCKFQNSTNFGIAPSSRTHDFTAFLQHMRAKISEFWIEQSSSRALGAAITVERLDLKRVAPTETRFMSIPKFPQLTRTAKKLWHTAGHPRCHQSGRIAVLARKINGSQTIDICWHHFQPENQREAHHGHDH